MNKKKLKIVWNDTKVFSPKNEDIETSTMETTGFLEIENDTFFIIKDPLTINIKTKKKHPERQPTLYFIPKSMVLKVEEMR